MKWKGVGGKRSRPNHCTVMNIPGKTKRSHKDASLKIAGVPAEIRTEHLQKRNLESHH
jgi:hypothetical protein